MRSKNSIINTIVAIIMNFINILISFFAQTIFIKTLGIEYNGINGLFLNIVSMLSIIELGIGSAIVYNLYKPIAENDKEKIKSLMQFYKKSYHIIAIIIFALGVCIIPLLNNIVGEVNINEDIKFIFFLFILDATFSYLLSYKRSILYANEKTYIVNIVHIGYLVLLNALQIVFLISTKNYIIYLILKIIFRVLENIIITYLANKKYPYIKEKNVEVITDDIKNNIVEKVKGLLFHKIGSFIVLGTDNIIISKFLGINVVGLYTNYNMIINALNQVMSQIYAAITASIGNLLVENNSDKSYFTYKKLMFFNYICSSFCAVVFCCLANPFVKVWLGKEFLISFVTVVILSLNFYMQSMRKTVNAFKEAAGVFYEDRMVPLIESIVNIIASIIFVNIFGLNGVFIGTIISTLVVYIYSYPKYVYIPIFKKKKTQFLKENLYYFVMLLVEGSICIFIVQNIIINNLFLEIILKLIISSIIMLLMDFLLFRKSEEYQYFINLLKK